MSSVVNRYNLPRSIPANIRATIRKADGYGCIKCGNIFIQYEHIDPLWCDAKEHNPDHMALLCSGCHGESTGKRLPKRVIYKLKKDPFCKKNGFAKASFYPDPSEMKINIGNSMFTNTDIALTLYGKPIIWVSKDPYGEDSPLLYNSIFMNSKGEKIGYLNKNNFIGLIGACDFQAISSRVEVRSRKGEINLILDIEGDEAVKIQRLHFKYHGCLFKLSSDGSIEMGSGMRISKIQTDRCFGGLSFW